MDYDEKIELKKQIYCRNSIIIILIILILGISLSIAVNPGVNNMPHELKPWMRWFLAIFTTVLFFICIVLIFDLLPKSCFYALKKEPSIIIKKELVQYSEIGNLEKLYFAGNKTIVLVELSEHTTKILDFCFTFCSSLESIILPKGITDIGKYAFYGCVSLKEIDMTKLENPPNLGGGAFPEKITINRNIQWKKKMLIDKGWKKSDINLLNPKI